MSIILRMIGCNARLADWENFPEEGRGSWSVKQPEKAAKILFAQLSHPKVVDLVVAEYDALPPQVRLELRELCNTGNASGNVRKNVQLLNQRLGGRLLAEEKFTRTVNVRRETIDGVRYDRKAVNEAVAAARRKYQK